MRATPRPWTPREHRRFHEGLALFGKSAWVSIAAHVGTRTNAQVASHAQKHFLRLRSPNETRVSVSLLRVARPVPCRASRERMVKLLNVLQKRRGTAPPSISGAGPWSPWRPKNTSPGVQ